MRKWRRVCALTLTLALLCPTWTGQARAEGVVYDVTEFGADGTDTVVDQKAIQTALNQGKNAAGAVTVTVPAGTYYINGTLGIYSNTTLRLDPDAVIRRIKETGAAENAGQQFGMLSARNIAGSGIDYAGYSLAQNITVEGGTWDGNSDCNTSMRSLMVFRHCRDITFRNFTLTHGVYHYLNISSSGGVTVENVTFSDVVAVPKAVALSVSSLDNVASARARFECIHMDAEGHNNTAYDDTVCQDDVITNCVFRKVYSGVGAHRRPEYNGEKLYAKNITISDNTFEDVMGHCINAYQFRQLAVTGNRCTRVGSLAWIDDATGVVSGQTVTLKRYGEGDDYGLRVASCQSPKGLTVTKNECSGDTDHVMRLYQCAQVQVSQNVLQGGKDASIYLSACTNCAVKDNTLTEVGEAGIYLTSGSRENKISGNGITGQSTAITQKGIQVSTCSDRATVTRNTVQNAAYGIYITGNTAAKLAYNTVKSGAAVGIYLTSTAKKVQITYNRLGGTGLRFASKTTKTILTPMLSKVKSSKEKTLTAYWRKTASASGYQIQYGTSSSLKGAKMITVSKNTLRKTISRCKRKKKYNVRIRAYQKVDGVFYYTQWSNSKSVTIS